MKSPRKVGTQYRPISQRSAASINPRIPDKQPKRKSRNTISFQQESIDFLREYQKYFPKYLLDSCGDADTYFRQTLRTSNQYDFQSLLKPRNKFKSYSEVQLKKKKSPPKTVPEKKVQTRKPVSSRKDPEEVDLDIFYSPTGESVKPLESTTSSATLHSEHFDKLTDGAMAEEEEEFGEDDVEEMQDPIVEPTPEEGPPEDETEDEEESPVEVDEEEEDDEMVDVEKIIAEASKELEQVAEKNQSILSGLESGENIGLPLAQSSALTIEAEMDSEVLRELEDAEKQAKETANIIYELKTRVKELLKKEQTTEAEAAELEQKNKELRAQMIVFEEKTRRIQSLIAQTNLFGKMVLPEKPVQVSYKEDILPKVVVCGVTEQNIPKLVLCDNMKNMKKKPCHEPHVCPKADINIPMSVVPKFAKRLSDSYCMQEKLAAENADLEGMRYKLQSDLLNKDQTIEFLQRKLCSIQGDMRMICKENTLLNEKIQVGPDQRPISGQAKMRAQCGKTKGPCPTDIENRLSEYSETTKTLEKQLLDMETDVKLMQTELAAVQAERDHMDQHKQQIIVCPPMCVPHPPCMPPPQPRPQISSADQHLRELREQYNRLQDDFKGKVTEVAGLRAENDKLKNSTKEAEDALKTAMEKVRECERNVKSMKLESKQFMGSKEQLVEQEQQLVVAKQRFREAQDELEELRTFLQEQEGQMNDYRNKYLEAQQEVEEQRRQIEFFEMDTTRINEQVNLEIQRVKNQFQEKLNDLLPLPDLLKTTQLKLQETQQMHLLAERNNEALNNELLVYKDKVAAIANQMEKVRSDQQLGEDEKVSMGSRVAQLEEKIALLQDENDILKLDLERTEDSLEESDKEVKARMHEIAQLSAQLEDVREESARQVARNKERCETVRRSMQIQISDLERQLAQSRAQARSAQKDRDDIRQKMQSQINNLHENFEDAQMRIRNLQGHVNFLKDTYTPPHTGGDIESVTSDPCNCD